MEKMSVNEKRQRFLVYFGQIIKTFQRKLTGMEMSNYTHVEVVQLQFGSGVTWYNYLVCVNGLPPNSPQKKKFLKAIPSKQRKASPTNTAHLCWNFIHVHAATSFTKTRHEKGFERKNVSSSPAIHVPTTSSRAVNVAESNCLIRARLQIFKHPQNENFHGSFYRFFFAWNWSELVEDVLYLFSSHKSVKCSLVRLLRFAPALYSFERKSAKMLHITSTHENTSPTHTKTQIEFEFWLRCKPWSAKKKNEDVTSKN